VRNPGTGASLERLAAVIFLFDRQSAFVASARADVDFTKLAPGDESPFVVAVDAPSSVARYRVSFRNEAGVVPHVDRRGQEPIARELP
jgi:predicted nuclease with RNAse H fold